MNLNQKAFLVLSSLLLFFLQSCSPLTGKPDLEKLAWLEGNWMSQNEMIFFESWEPTERGKMRGLGYSMENGDTLMSERLEIFTSDSGTFYKALVFGQNEGLPVYFRLIHHENDSFVFSNPDHDFPRFIVYNKLDRNNARIHVRDGFEDGSRGFQLNLEKMGE